MTPSPLFRPVRLGALELPSRIIMAPMTRNRASADGLAMPLMAEHYVQRAAAGLLVTEMSHVSAAGRAYVDTPGMHCDAQEAAWRKVVDAVHAAGGRIALQLAHAGRTSHPSTQPGGELPVGASPIAVPGEIWTREGLRPYVVPRALEAEEIPGIVAAFAEAAARARRAGFDGVEIHGANSYLLDQFLRDGTNRRTDAWGGTPENRARLLVEVAAAAAEAFGPGRVGVRISPFNPWNGMEDSDPATTFGVAAELLGRLPLAYLHVLEDAAKPAAQRLTPLLRARFGGPLVANSGYDRLAADAVIARGEADAVSFGVPYLANPDLPVRLALGAALNTPDPATFYGGGAKGYVDYPALEAAA